jgi:hypothetical protein
MEKLLDQMMYYGHSGYQISEHPLSADVTYGKDGRMQTVMIHVRREKFESLSDLKQFLAILEEMPHQVSIGGQDDVPHPQVPQSAQLPQQEETVDAWDVPDEEEPRQESALTFESSQLAGSVHNGKTYWKVKGGRFSKFGVTVWPEVLEQIGIKTGSLDPRQAYDLDNYVCEYVEKDGKPDKVVRFVKA